MISTDGDRNFARLIFRLTTRLTLREQMVAEVGCFSNYTFLIVGATGNINDMGNVDAITVQPPKTSSS